MTENNNQSFELEITDKAAELIEEYAQKTKKSQEEVIEYVLTEFLQNQLHVIERRAKETNEPINKLISTQFEKIIDSLNNQV
ncbi:peptidyl-tRNA hydrolase [Desulfohalotomaculum tongense]|uniref:hypothetical protein n=1 Tax=Desulforadius tongensis TaxID=1216062 RepID=UPI001958493A|nr:hypothetical protein [Desulforadius tongensis]MBM7854585.1 peptidyl-tRNA hydrolase [Desulforadius tongensis]